MKLEFSRQISTNTEMSNLVKIRPVESELFHADRRTDITKLMVAFHNSANAPKYEWRYISTSPLSSWLTQRQSYIFKHTSVGIPVYSITDRKDWC